MHIIECQAFERRAQRKHQEKYPEVQKKKKPPGLELIS